MADDSPPPARWTDGHRWVLISRDVDDSTAKRLARAVLPTDGRQGGEVVERRTRRRVLAVRGEG